MLLASYDVDTLGLLVSIDPTSIKYPEGSGNEHLNDKLSPMQILADYIGQLTGFSLFIRMYPGEHDVLQIFTPITIPTTAIKDRAKACGVVVRREAWRGGLTEDEIELLRPALLPEEVQ